MRFSIDFEDLLASSIAPQVVPPFQGPSWGGRRCRGRAQGASPSGESAILVDGERQSEKLSQDLQIFESLCQLSLLHLSFIAPDVCVMDGRWRLFCANPLLSTDYVTSGAATTPPVLCSLRLHFALESASFHFSGIRCKNVKIMTVHSITHFNNK